MTSDERFERFEFFAVCAIVLAIVIGGITLIWRSQTLGHERRLRTIEECKTVTDPVAKTDCLTGDVWE